MTISVPGHEPRTLTFLVFATNSEIEVFDPILNYHEFGLDANPFFFSPESLSPCSPGLSPCDLEPCGVLEHLEAIPLQDYIGVDPAPTPARLVVRTQPVNTRLDTQRLEDLLLEKCKPAIIRQEALTIAAIEHPKPTTTRVTRSSSATGSLIPAPQRASSQDSAAAGTDPLQPFGLQGGNGLQVPHSKPAPPPPSPTAAAGQTTSAAARASCTAPSNPPDGDPEDDPPDGDDGPGDQRPTARHCRWCLATLPVHVSWPEHNLVCSKRQPDLLPDPTGDRCEASSLSKQASRETSSLCEHDTSRSAPMGKTLQIDET